MARYLIRTNYTGDAFKGMIENPQNREPAIRKIFAAAGAQVNEVLYSISTGEVIIDSTGDPESMARIGMVTMATGTMQGYETVEVITAQEMAKTMDSAGLLARNYEPPTQDKIDRMLLNE